MTGGAKRSWCRLRSLDRSEYVADLVELASGSDDLQLPLAGDSISSTDLSLSNT